MARGNAQDTVKSIWTTCTTVTVRPETIRKHSSP
nr:MAG TPA: hypothetical protein [Caudoviricetes sp.]